MKVAEVAFGSWMVGFNLPCVSDFETLKVLKRSKCIFQWHIFHLIGFIERGLSTEGNAAHLLKLKWDLRAHVSCHVSVIQSWLNPIIWFDCQLPISRIKDVSIVNLTLFFCSRKHTMTKLGDKWLFFCKTFWQFYKNLMLFGELWIDLFEINFDFVSITICPEKICFWNIF